MFEHDNNDTPRMAIFAATRPSRNGKYKYQLLTGDPEDDGSDYTFIMYQDDAALYTIKGTNITPGVWYREIEWRDVTGVFYRCKESIVIQTHTSGVDISVDFDKDQIMKSLQREINNRSLDPNKMRREHRPLCTVKYCYQNRVEFSASFKIFQKRACEKFVAQNKAKEHASLDFYQRHISGHTPQSPSCGSLSYVDGAMAVTSSSVSSIYGHDDMFGSQGGTQDVSLSNSNPHADTSDSQEDAWRKRKRNDVNEQDEREKSVNDTKPTSNKAGWFI
eukprot:TRINITY_DN3318_c0_g1_i1.p1 TRINITY_DN3318_c0_g1~~TRINITY_DN3318_c0_g1_i1.p1  ORF type:complete len:276 (-),score=30.75 TRINITY_DN3318_c0_g1_i1:11-838(-)